jgi:hypothetical protein
LLVSDVRDKPMNGILKTSLHPSKSLKRKGDETNYLSVKEKTEMTHETGVMKKACFLMLVCALVLAVASVPNALCYPPAGSDLFESTATIELQIYGPSGFHEIIVATGPTTVNRSNPYDPGDGRIMIDTEIVSLNLVGYSTHIGSITVIESPSKASTGNIKQKTAGIDFPADSFFDVYIEIKTTLPSPLGTLHNDDPKHMTAVIWSIPPIGSTYESPITIILKDELGNIVGAMLATRHTVGAPVGGIVVPVDKLGSLAPYIGLPTTILVGTVATAVCVKRIKRREEKQ